MIHIGIIGGGNISETHARAAAETTGVEIAAIYGENAQKTARLQNLYGGRVVSSWESLLAHKPLDMVMIGSPSGLHAQQGIDAARAGLHVLVEKPIDITTARADMLIAECARARVKLGVCFQDRVASDICRLRQMIKDGRLGKPILACGKVKWYRPPEYYEKSRWRGTFAQDGGGALINQGIHTIDLLLWLMGDVTHVQAKAITALHDIEAEDTCIAVLEFANGAIGSFLATTAAYPGFGRRVELTGSKGTIILENDTIIEVRLQSGVDAPSASQNQNTNASESSPVVSDISGHKRLLKDFVDAIENNSEPVCNGIEGRRSVAVIEAIYQSSWSSEKVSLHSNS